MPGGSGRQHRVSPEPVSNSLKRKEIRKQGKQDGQIRRGSDRFAMPALHAPQDPGAEGRAAREVPAGSCLGTDADPDDAFSFPAASAEPADFPGLEPCQHRLRAFFRAAGRMKRTAAEDGCRCALSVAAPWLRRCRARDIIWRRKGGDPVGGADKNERRTPSAGTAKIRPMLGRRPGFWAPNRNGFSRRL